MPKFRQIIGVGMAMGFAPTWLRQVSPPASQNHFNHWLGWTFLPKYTTMPYWKTCRLRICEWMAIYRQKAERCCYVCTDVNVGFRTVIVLISLVNQQSTCITTVDCVISILNTHSSWIVTGGDWRGMQFLLSLQCWILLGHAHFILTTISFA